MVKHNQTIRWQQPTNWVCLTILWSWCLKGYLILYQCPSQTPRKHWNQLISRKSSHFIPPQSTGKPIVFWSLQGVLNENTVQEFVEESLGNELVKLPAVCRQWRYSSNFTVHLTGICPHGLVCCFKPISFQYSFFNLTWQHQFWCFQGVEWRVQGQKGMLGTFTLNMFLLVGNILCFFWSKRSYI